MTYPAAQSIQETFQRDEGWQPDDLEAEFLETMLWYGGFKDEYRLKLLPYDSQDLEVIAAKMQKARTFKDFATSDYLRDVLRQAGITVKNNGRL